MADSASIDKDDSVLGLIDVFQTYVNDVVLKLGVVRCEREVERCVEVRALDLLRHHIRRERNVNWPRLHPALTNGVVDL